LILFRNVGFQRNIPKTKLFVPMRRHEGFRKEKINNIICCICKISIEEIHINLVLLIERDYE
jgi:hypothetical protein